MLGGPDSQVYFDMLNKHFSELVALGLRPNISKFLNMCVWDECQKQTRKTENLWTSFLFKLVKASVYLVGLQSIGV